MGNKALWAALEERERLLEKPEMTDEDGIRLGELEGIVGDEDGYDGRSRRRRAAAGPGHPRASSTSADERAAGRPEAARAARTGALRQARRRCCSTSPRTTSTSTRSAGSRTSSTRYEGALITISHDRHFLNAICTHIADIDYETIITYTGGYDDMVLAKTQLRARIEIENAAAEKKIAQLQDFIARFSAGTRARRCRAAQEGSGAAADDGPHALEHRAPFIRFDMLRPSGKHTLRFEGI